MKGNGAAEYSPLGDDETEPRPKFWRWFNCFACIFALSTIIGIFTYFLYVAVTEARAAVNVDEFRDEFGPFLMAISYNYSDAYMTMAEGLVTGYGDYFVASLSMAISCQMQLNYTGAQYWLNKAHDDGVNDQYSYLLPSDPMWDNDLPEQQLYTAVEDQIWAIPYYYNLSTAQVYPNFATGYIVKLNATTIFFLNPVEIEDSVLAQIQSTIGNITHLIEQSLYHYMWLPWAISTWPNAEVWGVPAQATYGPIMALNIPWTGFLNDSNPLFPGDVIQMTFQGEANDECGLFHIKTGSGFYSDLLYLSDFDKYTFGGIDNQTPFFSRLWFWTYGVYNQLGVPNNLNITNPQAFAQSITNMENEWDFSAIYFTNGGRITDSAGSDFSGAFDDYT